MVTTGSTGTAFTVSTALALATICPLVAVRTKVVDVVLVTARLPTGLTVPISGSILTDVAFVTFHDTVALWPADTTLGLTVKLAIVGITAVLTVTVTLAETVPPRFVAVRT